MSSRLNDAQTESEEDKLSEEVNDPTAMLTQVRLFEFYTPENFRSSAQTNVALIQPIIPVARLSLLPVEQIIRPTVKLSTTATGPGGHTVTGLSDIQLYDLFQSQWPHLDRWNLRWAIGTTFVFPTATDRKNGAGAWQMGPAAALAFAGVPNLWVGVLIQNPISFAYTRSDATPQNAMLFQPGFSYRLGQGWYVKSTDSVWTINWRHETPTTIPVSLGVGKISQLDGQMIDTWVSGERMAYEQSTGSYADVDGSLWSQLHLSGIRAGTVKGDCRNDGCHCHRRRPRRISCSPSRGRLGRSYYANDQR